MGIGVDILDLNKVRETLRSYLKDTIDKGGDALVEIAAEDFRDVFVVMLVIREMHLELLSKKITPVIRLDTGMKPIDAIETALLMKSFAIATEKLQKFHPKIKLADLRATINEEALDTFKGKSKQEVVEELKKAYPEAKLTLD